MTRLAALAGFLAGTIAGILVTVHWAVGHPEPDTGTETRDPSRPAWLPTLTPVDDRGTVPEGLTSWRITKASYGTGGN